MIEKSVDIFKDLEPTWSTVVSKQVNSKFEQVSDEMTRVKVVLDDTKKRADDVVDRENRSLNVILYRVPEVAAIEERSKSDKAFCLELITNVLEVDAHENDFKLIRLGKRDLNNRPLMIQFREKTLKNRVMECLHKLKAADDKFKNISVTHDMTKADREECKSLVEEAKKKQTEETGEYLWGVRGLPGQLKLVKLRKH